MVLLDIIIITSMSIFAVVSVVWYFRMRKKMIVLMKNITEDLERIFKPVDKTYVLLGYLVGYRAKYELENGDKVYILFTTAPRYSILYYPILKILKRVDRLEIAIANYNRYVSKELHAVLASDVRTHALLLRDLGSKKEVISTRTIDTAKGQYIVYYEDSGDIEFMKKFLDVASLRVYRVSAFTKSNLVGLVTEIREGTIPEAVKLLREVNRYVTKTK
ncbi:MAG: hypothetical protein RMI56_00960 [Sulfolobales archaeon]|nr:hypothetical protein [Sulfolobales archaeon]MDW8082349.1 hypothetical protein [Sulfolobales archaeon]